MKYSIVHIHHIEESRIYTTGRYEAKITDMKASTLIALADYFNVTTDYVLGRTDKHFIDKRKVLESLTETHTKLIAELCMDEKD